MGCFCSTEEVQKLENSPTAEKLSEIPPLRLETETRHIKDCFVDEFAKIKSLQLD
jgi:hypothetical protein